MKTKQYFTLALAVMITVSLSVSVWAQPPKMKMTTEIPPGIATPDKLETRLGTLTSFDGVPDAATAQKVYDNLDFQRATQAYLNSIQIASMNGMRKGILEFGPANTTALLFESLMDSTTLFLTPNTTSIYMLLWLDLTDGPMVLETPPNVIGLIDDAWFHCVADFGQVGPDKNKGGRYLMVPPGYKGEIPDGYFVKKSETFGNWVIWRGAQVNGDTGPAVNATKKTLRVYPLAKKDYPPKMTFLNVSGKEFNTIHSMDAHFFDEVNEVIQREPPQGQDPEILGQLASIGIRKGQPFKPDARMKNLQGACAAQGAGQILLVFHALRQSNARRAPDRPAVPGHRQQQERHTAEQRWFVRHLLRSESAKRAGEQLDPEHSREELVHHPARLWAAGAMDR